MYRLSCLGSLMEDFDGVSSLPSLPAISALPGAKLVLTVSARNAEGIAMLVVALDRFTGQHC